MGGERGGGDVSVSRGVFPFIAISKFISTGYSDSMYVCVDAWVLCINISGDIYLYELEYLHSQSNIRNLKMYVGPRSMILITHRAP